MRKGERQVKREKYRKINEEREEQREREKIKEEKEKS